MLCLDAFAVESYFTASNHPVNTCFWERFEARDQVVIEPLSCVLGIDDTVPRVMPCHVGYTGLSE